MSGFYEGLAKTAAQLIKEKGQAVVLRRATVSVYAAESGAQVTYNNVGMFGAVFDWPSKDVDGHQILRGDKKVLMESSQEPTSKDRLIIGGVEHEIVNAKPLAPGGIAVIYTVQARAGG